jgi:hypothetical protein
VTNTFVSDTIDELRLRYVAMGDNAMVSRVTTQVAWTGHAARYMTFSPTPEAGSGVSSWDGPQQTAMPTATPNP